MAEKPDLMHLHMGGEPCGHTDGEAAQVVAEAVQLILNMLHGKGSLLGCRDHLPQGHSRHLAHVTPPQQTNDDGEQIFRGSFNKIIIIICHY